MPIQSPFARMLVLPLLVLGLAAAAAQSPAPAAPGADRWEPDIAAFETADRRAPPAPGGVVFVGSSSIRMWTTLARDFPGQRVINRGFGGSAVADATRYADRIVIPYRPRIVVLYAGDNDLAEGHPPAQVLADAQGFVARVRQTLPNVRIAYLSIKPSPSRVHLLPAVRDANARIRAWATTQPGVDFIDVATPMLDTEGQPRAGLFLEDRLHMNAEGYALWTQIVAPYVAAATPR